MPSRKRRTVRRLNPALQRSPEELSGRKVAATITGRNISRSRLGKERLKNYNQVQTVRQAVCALGSPLLQEFSSTINAACRYILKDLN